MKEFISYSLKSLYERKIVLYFVEKTKDYFLLHHGKYEDLTMITEPNLLEIFIDYFYT
jgi:hypothetical protein